MRALLGTVTVLFLLAFSACQSDDKDGREGKSADPTSASSSESDASEPTDSGDGETLSTDDVELKILTGAPPKDLTWAEPEVPSDWRRLQTGAGEFQWQIDDSRCAVFLNQPAGLGDAEKPTSDDVVTDLVDRAVRPSGATVEMEPVEQQLLTNKVNAANVSAKTSFSGIHFTASPGDIEGQAYGYRDGDFALAAISICGGGQYADYGDEIEDWLLALEARTTY